MKVLTVVGARPQFIKVAPVARAMASDSSIQSVLVHTGQHFDDNMSAVFFDELEIPEPDRNLGIHAGPHGQMTGRMIEALEQVISEDAPDWVLVYGDTNSTLAAAIAASKLPVRLAHVEAGLRSFNRAMPEEVNRVLTDHLSEVCFTPTSAADENLRREGVADGSIIRCGDVMFDAVRIFSARAIRSSDVLARAGVEPEEFVLATVHRAENTDDPDRLRRVLEGLSVLSESIPVVLPLHPRTAKSAQSAGLPMRGILVLPPMGYLDMLALEAGARCVVTDSGGVQKEAFFQGRPCVTMRTETEWVELVALGWNRLVSPTSPDFVERLQTAVSSGPGSPAAPYGDGHASERILRRLLGG